MMKNLVSDLGIVLLISAALFGCLRFPPKGADAFYNQSYGSHQRNKLDVFLPEDSDSTTETVVLIHGGAWVAGDKGGAELKDMRNSLLDAGYAVASMNYRYACGNHTKQMEDVGNAIELIQDKANDWNINDSRLALMGFSAGGHLALLYGHAFNPENVVKTVVSVVGPTDLTDSLFRTYATNYNLWWTIETLVGATLEQDTALYQEASPVYNWSEMPTLFVYGGQDDLVPAEQGIAMFDTLMIHGVATDTVVPPLATHNVNGSNNMYRQLIETEVISWLTDHLE